MIISLVAILMLLSDESTEENEVQWFFPNRGNNVNNDKKFETQFLGWKMGSASGKDKTKKNKTSDAKEETFFEQSAMTSPTWKTLIIADSTIHYIPLEDVVTVRNLMNSFIPEDALDPFYLDSISQFDTFNNELFNNQGFYKVPTPITQHLLFQKPSAFHKKSSMLYCPVGLPLQKKIMHVPSGYGRAAPHPLTYQGKPEIEPGLLPEVSHHTMFVHPRLLNMMKAMDRSILSYPSKFEYKSLDQLRKGPKRVLPNRYNDKIIL